MAANMTFVRLAVAAGLLLIAGCESDRFDFFGNDPTRTGPQGAWIKEGAGADQRAAAMRECRQNAMAQIERDRRIDEDAAGRDAGAGTAQGTEDLMQSMERYGYQQRLEVLFTRCMQGKGYRRE